MISGRVGLAYPPDCRWLPHPRRPERALGLDTGPGRCGCHHLNFLVQPEPHADEPVQGCVGVDEGVEGLVALAVALGLPGSDGTAALEAGDDALGGEPAEVVGVEATEEVDLAGAGLGQAQTGVDRVLHRVHAGDQQRDLALVRVGRPARPDGDAGPAAALDRSHGLDTSSFSRTRLASKWLAGNSENRLFFSVLQEIHQTGAVMRFGE